jgi:hypothetical protein
MPTFNGRADIGQHVAEQLARNRIRGHAGEQRDAIAAQMPAFAVARHYLFKALVAVGWRRSVHRALLRSISLLFPDSVRTREALDGGRGIDSFCLMVRSGFLSEAERQTLVVLARDGLQLPSSGFSCRTTFNKERWTSM